MPANVITGVYEGLGEFEQTNMWRNKAIAERAAGCFFSGQTPRGRAGVRSFFQLACPVRR